MNIDFQFYLKIFFRRLPTMTLLVLLGSSIGVITALKLPETWTSSARLFVEAPQIPENMVSTTVQVDPLEQLDIIQERLLTRANLIDIANRFEVFENIRSIEPDSVVEQMRSMTSVRRSAGRDRATLLSIEFTARTGRIANEVVNEFVTIVLEENSRFRVSRAESTLSFFEQEVGRLGEDLDRQSSDIAAFKSRNADALPADQNFRLGRQALLQERLAGLERERRIAAAQLQEAERQLQTIAAGEMSESQSFTGVSTPEESSLLVAEADLARARSSYSESDPRVIRLLDRVDRLRSIVAAQASSMQPDGSGGGSLSPQQIMLQTTKSELETRMDLLDSDIASVNEELSELGESIMLSAANGIALDALEREFSSIQTRYNAALGNLNNARMSERIETTAQGQRITVIESASLPRIPSGPNRPKTAAIGGVVGLAMAASFFLLLEALNRTIRRPQELVARYNVVPIAVVPYIESRRERFFRRGGIVLATLAILVGVPSAMWYIDQNYLPLEIVVRRGLERFGLG